MKRQLGFVIDLKRCIGCRTCAIGCKMENSVPLGHFRMQVLNPQNTLVYDKPLGEFPNVHIHWFPMPCQHCADPPCVKECPTGAMQKREKDGIVIVEKDICTGCQSCEEACPYEVIAYNEKTETVDKCTMCAHRIDKGAIPFCASICVGRAIQFGNVNDANSRLIKQLAFRKHERLKEDKGTRPSVYYLSP